MRQSLITITSSEIENYDIPKLYFDENVIIIVYDQFTHNLFRYVHTPRIFVVPKEIYVTLENSTYTITEDTINIDGTIISNIDATINGEPYFPKDLIELERQHTYIENYRKYIPKKVVEANLKNLEGAMEYLQSIKIESQSFSNLDVRIQRLRDFGNAGLADKLTNYYKKNMMDFINASSLSLQFNNLDDISLEPMQTKNPALYYKLDNNVGVLGWHGYSTFIDTFTRILFYTSVSNYITLFSKYFTQYKPVVVVYGILNYHLAQGIHEKTNKNDQYYKMLVKELG